MEGNSLFRRDVLVHVKLGTNGELTLGCFALGCFAKAIEGVPNGLGLAVGLTCVTVNIELRYTIIRNRIRETYVVIDFT